MYQPRETVMKDDDEIKALAGYYVKQEEARGKGLDTIISVGLATPKNMRHVLMPGESGLTVVTCWINSGCDWPRMLDQLNDAHAPMIVKWVMPIGTMPLLLSPPQ